MNLKKLSKLWMILLPAIALLLFSAADALANFDGGIYTTFKNGSTVNGNVYPSKDAVYLDGGPQHLGSNGLPDGDYYFQVTDPSGTHLLSSDNIRNRRLKVVNGVVSGHQPDPDDPVTYKGHADGDFNPMNGTMPVQLAPFADTPNMGGEYKVWLTPVDQYVTANANNPQKNFGFTNGSSKTDNFKVLTGTVPPQTVITGVKYYHYSPTLISNFDPPGATDAPIPGWIIFLQDASGNPILDMMGNPVMTTTDADGVYKFIVPQDGTQYTIAENLPPGWNNSTSLSQVITANQMEQDVNFANYRVHSLGGLKYRDLDMNGVQNNGEPVIPSTTKQFTFDIAVTYPDTNHTTATLHASTGPDGTWTLSGVPEGTTYTVSEEAVSNWMQTGPADSADQTANPHATGKTWTGTVPNGDVTGLDFGNIQLARIGGVKYRDLNMNGSQDNGEPIITDPSFTIQVVATLPNGTMTTATYPTSGGSWISDYFPEGTTCVVSELPMAGWRNTGPAANNHTYPNAVVGEMDTTGYDFGNIKLYNISGLKYRDLNMNGSRDNGEPVIPSTTQPFTFDIAVTYPDMTTAILHATTGTDGTWSVTGLPEGTTYTITEEAVPGWINTGPVGGSYTGTLTADATGKDFGNIQLIKISGHKYYDKNANGLEDDANVPVSGFTINVTSSKGLYNQNGSVFTGTLVTDANGFWCIYVPEGSAVTAAEVINATQAAAGWLETGPINANTVMGDTFTVSGFVYSGTVTQTDTGLDFLNVKLVQGSGGLTLGFWSNNNGKSILSAHDPEWRGCVNGLVSSPGLPTLTNNPLYQVSTAASFADAFNGKSGIPGFNPWLLGANSNNAAYMLAVQLTATTLDLKYGASAKSGGFLGSGTPYASDGSTILYLTGSALTNWNIANNTPGNTNPFVTIAQVVQKAKDLLNSSGGKYTVSASTLRNQEVACQTILNGINNNQYKIVAPGP